MAVFVRFKETVQQPLRAVEVADLKVLAIDDNSTNRIIIEKMLENIGCRITLAKSGQEGIDALESARRMGDPYRLVLLDLQMPEMDGEMTLRAIKSNPLIHDTRVIVLTPWGDGVTRPG